MLSQNFWKKIQNVGLQTEYGKDAIFAVQLRRLIALAFVPQTDVMRAYELVILLPFFAETKVTSSIAKDKHYWVILRVIILGCAVGHKVQENKRNMPFQ